VSVSSFIVIMNGSADADDSVNGIASVGVGAAAVGSGVTHLDVEVNLAKMRKEEAEEQQQEEEEEDERREAEVGGWLKT
jgi:hypothetical protein